MPIQQLLKGIRRLLRMHRPSTWLLFWIKYLDAVIARYDNARLIYSGTYLIGRKPAAG